MDNNNIYDGFTDNQGPSSADPSERRLTVYLSASGVKAYLRNTIDVTNGYRTLIDASWKCETKDLLRKIENCIYDHPEVLDDYECDVIIESDKVMWVPVAVAEDEEMRAIVYNSLYPNVEDSDIFEDLTGKDEEDAASLYTLCPGLSSFLQRTFPGAKISCQQTQLFSRFKGRVTDEPSIFADLRDGRMDILIFRGNEFLMGSTHRYADEQDAYYHILNCIRQCHLDEKKCEVYLSGDRQTRTVLLNDLRDELSYVRNTMLPRIDTPREMPTAALVCNVNHRLSTQ